MVSTASYSSADDPYDSDEPPELSLNLPQLKLIASSIFGRPCTAVRKLTRGRYHEVFVLSFGGDVTSPGGSAPSTPSSINPPDCIARFSRSNGYSPSSEHSAIATMRYVSQKTKIPVPKIYHISTEPESASVGAPFVLMQRMPGVHLYKFWDQIDIPEKLSVVRQIAVVVAELGSLQFGQIGTLAEARDGDGVVLRGIENHAVPGDRKPRGPWASVEDWLATFIGPEEGGRAAITSSSHLTSIRHKLHTFLTSRSEDPSFRPPFGLLHTDFDAQNLLFTRPPDAKLTAVIDWDNSHTAPRHFIYDFPIFLQNDPYRKDDWAINRTLRREFVGSILRHLEGRRVPGEGGDDQVAAAKSAFSRKSYFVNRFAAVFMMLEVPIEEEERREWAAMRESLVKCFVEDLEGGKGNPYDGEWYQEENYEFNEISKESGIS